MSKTYKTTIVAIAVHRKDESPIYGDGTTTIRIDDEGGGPFLTISQSPYDGKKDISLDMEELKVVYWTAKGMMKDVPNL